MGGAETVQRVEDLPLDLQIFEDRFLNITYAKLEFSDEQLAEVRGLFYRQLTPTGVHVLKPHRVDVLRKPAV